MEGTWLKWALLSGLDRSTLKNYVSILYCFVACIIWNFIIPAVLIVLVTDMVVILVEKEQKYHLACLQDRKVIYPMVSINWNLCIQSGFSLQSSDCMT